MLTYRLQTRVFRIAESLAFPNKVIIRAKLAPSTAFGTEDKPSRTIVRARESTMAMNFNSGRCLAHSRPPLERLKVTLENPPERMVLDGDEVRYEFPCQNITELEAAALTLQWMLPPLLNLAFADPPTVERIDGFVGEVPFGWEHKFEDWRINIRTVTAEQLQKHFEKMLDSLHLFDGVKNRRLAAAITYFHVAARLNVCGDSPWEFMAETILNYAKAMDILFKTSKDSMDDARRELAKLGYSTEEVEGDFIPLLILRNWIDVAHPKVAIFKPAHLKVLYHYMAAAEENMRELLMRIMAKIEDGSYALRQDGDLRLDGEEERGFSRLIERMASRIGVRHGPDYKEIAISADRIRRGRA